MFRHLFRLIWNKKRQNLLLISEMLFSFLVIFAVFTMVVYNYNNYKKPKGFDHDNVWVVSFRNGEHFGSADSAARFYEAVWQTLRSVPQVLSVSYVSENYPYSNSMNGTAIFDRERVIVDDYKADDDYKDMLHVNVLEGRWFDKQDAVAKDRPVVINASLREKLFGKGAAMGKVIHNYDADAGGPGKDNYKVIGVIEDMKDRNDYSPLRTGIYFRMDTADYQWVNSLLVRVTPGVDAAFEGFLYKIISNMMKQANVEIEHLENKRIVKNRQTIVPMIIFSIVSLFLVANVALGFFGVLWYNINKRRAEIGLRRAVGATGKSVSAQLVAEALILATFSLVIGSFFAIQFPLLNVFDLSAGTYLTALGLAVAFIYLLVMACALYPGRQAAAVYPARALHED